jgi:hypothetical protein
MKSGSNRWDRWIYPLTKDVDNTFCLAVSAVLAKRGMYAEDLASLVFQGRIREVVEYSVPVNGIGLDDLRATAQIQGLFKKNGDLDIGFNPLRAAVEASINAELQCQSVNRYFGQLCPFGGVVSVISRARRKIKAVLGNVPTLEKLRPRMGPGATTTIKRSDACWENKLGQPIVCSEDLIPYVHDFLAEVPAWARYSASWSSCSYGLGRDGEVSFGAEVPVVVDTGKLIFVAKNAKTHRPICVEPLFNGFWQLGVGDYIKHRLRVHAYQDLRNQERNQLAAREGSICGNLATIDLSSASDTLAFSVVFDLLPDEWVDLLARLRTGKMTYSGHEYELEKFSSMGNGFTFELETLIFWSLAFACVEACGEDVKKINVYGDDIIVPTGAVDLLLATLTWCGFNVNSEKSFWTGRFRESCGADWYHGEDVRPIYKKDRLSYQWLFTFHNWAMRRGERELASIAKSFIPNDLLKLTGPDGYGDGHLLGTWETIKGRKARNAMRSGWGGGYFNTLRETPKSVETDTGVAVLTGLFSEYVRGGSQDDEPHEQRRPGIVPGSLAVERTSIYTFSEHIFIR